LFIYSSKVYLRGNIPHQLLRVLQNTQSSFQLVAPITLAAGSFCDYNGLRLITIYKKVLDDILLLQISETLLIQTYFLKNIYNKLFFPDDCVTSEYLERTYCSWQLISSLSETVISSIDTTVKERLS